MVESLCAARHLMIRRKTFQLKTDSGHFQRKTGSSISVDGSRPNTHYIKERQSNFKRSSKRGVDASFNSKRQQSSTNYYDIENVVQRANW